MKLRVNRVMDRYCIPFRAHGLLALGVLMSLGASDSAAAQGDALRSARPYSFAIVVGSNKGTDKQQTLRFAQEDADAVATVLRQIGGYEKGAVQVLKEPDPIELRRTIQGLAREIKRHESRDEKTQLFFYYSGHANAKSLNLGGAEFSLSELRELLSDLSASLTLVVLDACQSGTFSRAKGAEPASDFAYNSVSGLKTEGFAVMASSSGDELQSSYFTHHLLVAMRGGGDTDRDGRVSLEEGYQYAYNRTLRDTSQTKIGGQHVTLERELTGHGSVALSYPRESDAMLTFGSDRSGTFLVQKPGGGAVMAEVKKSVGNETSLALPSGVYEIGWRDGDQLKRCELRLGKGSSASLSDAKCRRDPRRSGEAKGLRLDKSEAMTPKKKHVGRLKLSIGQAFHGAALGAEICVLANCKNPRVWAGATLAGIGIGLGIALLATPDGIHPATAAAINGGMIWGATSSYLLFGATSRLYKDDSDDGVFFGSGNALIGSLMAGQIGGLGLGLLADHILAPTEGEVSGALGGSWWAMGLTGLIWGAIRFDDDVSLSPRAIHGALFAISQAGLVGGYLLADHVNMSSGRVYILHAGGLMGAGLGALGTFFIRDDQATGQGFMWSAAAGAAVGLGLTYFLTRNFDTPDLPVEFGLMPTKGGVMAQLRMELK